MDNEMNTRTPRNDEKILWKCECGWETVTTFKGCESTRGSRGVARRADSNLALPRQVRQEGPKARSKTTEQMEPMLQKAKMSQRKKARWWGG